jgi:hypothetical protein
MIRDRKQSVLLAACLVTLVAHRVEAQHSRIHLSDGGELGVGEVKYDGSSAVGKMIGFNGGVLTAFSNCGPPNPQPACVHWSQDGQNLGAGPRRYAGSSPVTAMVAYKDGVLYAPGIEMPSPSPERSTAPSTSHAERSLSDARRQFARRSEG